MTAQQLHAAGVGVSAAPQDPTVETAESAARPTLTQEEKTMKRRTMQTPQESVPVVRALPATSAASQQPANVQRRSLVDAVYTESINLEAITDAVCRVVQAITLPTFGLPAYDLAVLFDAVKAFSAVLKQMLSVVEGYASTFPDPEKQETLLSIAEEMKASNTKELFEGIKAINAKSTDVAPLRKAVRNILINVWQLYRASEAVSVEDLINTMQTSVVTTKNMITAAGEATATELSMLADLTVIGVLRVTSLVQEHTFSTIRHPHQQRSLHEAGFMQAQAVRGLVLAAAEYNRLRTAAASAGQSNSPALELANNNMTALLKKVAEQVRAVSKHLNEEPTQTPIEMPAEAVTGLINRGVALITNARDKYLNKSASTHLANDEKDLLDVATNQIQLLKDLITSFPQRNGQGLMKVALSTAENVAKMSSTLQPFLEHTLDQFVREQCLLGIESSIRCDIQLKILLAAAALRIEDVKGLDVQLVSHIVQLWGVYWTFLLDSVWRAAQLPM